jgi:DNA polymerase-1
LRDLFLELEFHSLAKDIAAQAPAQQQKPKASVNYVTVDTIDKLHHAVARAREVDVISIDTETLIHRDNPQLIDPLRSVLISLSFAVSEGEAYYFPLRHTAYQAGQGELLVDASGDRSATDAPEERGLIRGGGEAFPEEVSKTKTTGGSLGIAARMLRSRPSSIVRNLPPLGSSEMEPLRALLEDPSVRKTAQNAKYDKLALRCAGVNLSGLDFDTMLASYVLDPGRRSHGLDGLALEFLDHTMTSYADLCG